jgi:hypothetical protein
MREGGGETGTRDGRSRVLAAKEKKSRTTGGSSDTSVICGLKH